MNLSTIPAADALLVQSVLGSPSFSILVALLGIGIAVLPIMNYFASRREEKRRIREVSALELQAQALYSISNMIILSQRKITHGRPRKTATTRRPEKS